MQNKILAKIDFYRYILSLKSVDFTRIGNYFCFFNLILTFDSVKCVAKMGVDFEGKKCESYKSNKTQITKGANPANLKCRANSNVS